MNFIKKIDIYYIVTLLFLLISANASFLSASDFWWFAVLLIMLIVATNKKLLKVKELRVISLFSFIYIALVVVRDFFVNGLETPYLLSDAFFLVKLVYFSFLYCVILQEKAASYLVKVITHLTIISLFFFAFQLVGLSDLIYKFSTTLNLQSNNTVPGYTNFVIFTFHKNFHDYANSGFSWEPGAFGCFLIIALLFNLSLNKFIFDRRSIILIIGIISTLATTDYLALIIVLFLAYRYRVPKINFGAVILILVFIGLVIFIPFLGSKIKDTYYEDLDDLGRLKFLEKYYHHNQMQIPLNRFSSMVYIYQQFGTKLILGVSNKYGDIVNKAYDINISNGLFDFLAKFGLVGLVYLLYKYAKLFLKLVIKAEYVIYCMVVLLVIGFGEPVLVLPIVLMFMFLPEKQINIDKPAADEDNAAPDAVPASSSKYAELRKFDLKRKKSILSN